MATTTTTKKTAAEVVQLLPIAKVLPATDNLRQDLGDLDGLVDSIRTVGIIEPLIVEADPKRKDHYRVVAGHRRLAAAKKARDRTVPCIVRTLDDPTRVETMLVENLQRQDLGHLEQARGFARLSELGWSTRKIGERVGCNSSHVSRHLKILKLPAGVLGHLDAGDITMVDAIAVADLDDSKAATAIVNKHLGARRRSEYSPELTEQVRNHERDTARAATIADLRAKLEKKGLTVAAKAPYNQRLEWLEIKEPAHTKEPCHAVTIETAYDPIRAVAFCTDPKRHAPDGDSKLKAKAMSRGTSMTTQQSESAKAEAQAQWARFQTAQQLVRGTPSKAEVLDFALACVLEASADEDPVGMCQLLGIALPEKDQHWAPAAVALDEFAAQSEANRLRVALAGMLTLGEAAQMGRFEALKLLQRHGYQLTEDEADALESVDASKRDQAASAPKPEPEQQILGGDPKGETTVQLASAPAENDDPPKLGKIKDFARRGRNAQAAVDEAITTAGEGTHDEPSSNGEPDWADEKRKALQ